MPTTHPSDRIHFISARFYKDSTNSVSILKGFRNVMQGFQKILRGIHMIPWCSQNFYKDSTTFCKDSRRFCEEFTWFLDIRKISTKIPQHSERIPKGFARISEDSARDSHDSLIFAKFILRRWIQRFKIPWNSSRWRRIPQDSTIIQKDSTLFYRIPTWNQL